MRSLKRPMAYGSLDKSSSPPPCENRPRKLASNTITSGKLPDVDKAVVMAVW